MHTRAYTYIYDKLILHLDKKPQVIVKLFTLHFGMLTMLFIILNEFELKF